MPRQPIDYSRTKFYKLGCKDVTITDIYVGHTTCWKDRKYNHHYHCCNETTSKYNYKVYQFIRNNGGWDNWDMILIEECDCKNRLEAEQKERHFIETLNATLNQLIPSRTQKEYYEDNKENHLEKCKKYYEKNKEDILEYHKRYYTENKENILEYQKQYEEKNREKKREYHKQYREQNREIINEKKREKIICECGSTICRAVIARHQQSKKHQDYMNSKESA